jgi:hypothetical protein
MALVTVDEVRERHGDLRLLYYTGKRKCEGYMGEVLECSESQ